MRRGVSSGGGQSSLDYLFGSGEPAKPPTNHAPPEENPVAVAIDGPTPKPSASAPEADKANKQIPAGIHSTASNNYHRADGQNTGNFITDRPTTRVHAAPGGGSSLDYLFGGGGN